MEPHSCKHIAGQFSQGDEQALAHFFDCYYSRLSIYCYQITKDRELGEELASEAFVKTWKFHHKLDSYAGIKAYLYTVARRECLNAISKSKTKNILELVSADCSTPSHFEAIVKSETYALLYEKINKLSAPLQEVLHKYYFENKSTGEIAKELNISRYTIKARRARGVELLKQELKFGPLFVMLLLKFFMLL